MKKFFVLLFVVLLQVGCATVENDFDPLEPANRTIDVFNTDLDEAVLRPIATGYASTVPKVVRTSVTNFFDNLAIPNTILNDVLQGKIHQGLSDTCRFMVNSTVGVVGLFDVASHMGLKAHQEDFGQTLATWGVDQGAYLVYPILGANSVRNTPGTVMAYLLDGATYLSLALVPEVVVAVTILKYIDQRANIEDFVKLRDELALDPYVFVREGWRQSRTYHIYDGDPPEPAKEDDDFFDDAFEDDFD